VSPTTIVKLEDHPLSDVSDISFDTLAAGVRLMHRQPEDALQAHLIICPSVNTYVKGQYGNVNRVTPLSGDKG
jgi:hypothetical protein